MADKPKTKPQKPSKKRQLPYSHSCTVYKNKRWRQDKKCRKESLKLNRQIGTTALQAAVILPSSKSTCALLAVLHSLPIPLQLGRMDKDVIAHTVAHVCKDIKKSEKPHTLLN